MSEEVSKYHIKNDTRADKSKFAANHIKAVAEWSWWKGAEKKKLLKEFDLTEEDFNEIRSTCEYKEHVFNLMFENRSAEEFEAWSSRHSDNMYQRLGEIVGLDPEIVSDLVEQVRQVHADRSAGGNMETQTLFTVPQILAMRQWFHKKDLKTLGSCLELSTAEVCDAIKHPEYMETIENLMCTTRSRVKLKDYIKKHKQSEKKLAELAERFGLPEADMSELIGRVEDWLTSCT